jgi:hypothetical protein
MLTAHVERYISLRQTLGFKLRNTARRLQAFARFATARNDTHIRASTAVAWAAEAPGTGKAEEQPQALQKTSQKYLKFSDQPIWLSLSVG